MKMKDVANTARQRHEDHKNGRRRSIDLILLMPIKVLPKAVRQHEPREDGSGIYWGLPISSLDKSHSRSRNRCRAAAFCRFNADARTEQILVRAILTLLTGNGWVQT
jgi:hypothetical protein